jgi:hypothetical protein
MEPLRSGLHRRQLTRGITPCTLLLLWTISAAAAAPPDTKPSPAVARSSATPQLLAHWPLNGTTENTLNPNATILLKGKPDTHSDPNSTGFFNSGTWLEIPADMLPHFSHEDFTISVKVLCDASSTRVTGDLISQYDPASARGFHLTLKSSPGVTSSQAGFRHLQFGIDDQQLTSWQDHGRPGTALLGFSMVEHKGELYVGTCQPGKDEAGHVYRYTAPDQWTDCGSPDTSNSVTAMAVFEGQLYAGTGKYRVAGSSLPESENDNPGGRIFRYDGDQRWIDCGQLPNTEAVGGMVVFNDRLFASSLYKPAGFFRFDGRNSWSPLPVPESMDAATRTFTERRVESLTVYEGHLYAGSYDGGHVYRFDGTTWEDCGQLGDNTQTYSFTQYDGALYVGTWPSGRVYRFQSPSQWIDCGRLGQELEVMGMMVHNGRLLAGTLPLAEVYEYRGATDWTQLTQLDHTPDVRYRRAWTMAEHNGRLFCSTLPSGHIYSVSAGQQVQWGHPLPPRWCEVIAVRSADRLTLFVDRKQVAQSPPLKTTAWTLTSQAPLRIGAGMNGTLNGRLSDLRIYRGAVTADSINTLPTAP